MSRATLHMAPNAVSSSSALRRQRSWVRIPSGAPMISNSYETYGIPTIGLCQHYVSATFVLGPSIALVYQPKNRPRANLACNQGDISVETHPTLTPPETKGIVLIILGYLPFPRGHRWEQNATQRILTFIKEINALDGITGGVNVVCVFTPQRPSRLWRMAAHLLKVRSCQ